jgi:phage recombination protein Bet
MSTMNALTKWGDKQLSLIRNTVAKDTTPAEFDLFIHTCGALQLDPLRKQAHAFVFGKKDPAKRQLTIVTSIGGYRSIAERTGAYRPDDRAPRFEMGEKNADTNPLGIIRCEVTVYKHSHGEWFPVVGEAWWDEYVPLYDGKIDRTKQGWTKMPRIMIAKCAEANALRKAWPDNFSGLHEESEIDRAHSIDLTPSEIADAGDQAKRLEMIGGKNTIMIDWMDGEPLQRVPTGKFGDAAMAFIRQHMKPGEEEASHILQWRDKNRHALVEYWALDKDGALMLKAELEKVEAKLKSAPKQEAA